MGQLRAISKMDSKINIGTYIGDPIRHQSSFGMSRFRQWRPINRSIKPMVTKTSRGRFHLKLRWPGNKRR